MCYLQSMDWTAVVSGVVGGFAGSAVPGWLAWLGLRRERARQLEDRWSGKDAPVVAEAIRLLVDVDPARRLMSISPVQATEQATWDEIQERRSGVSSQLLAMRAGHPSDSVRACAGELEGQVAAAVVQTLHAVRDSLGNRNVPGQVDLARECHEKATATAERLQGLVIAFGSGTRQKRGR